MWGAVGRKVMQVCSIGIFQLNVMLLVILSEVFLRQRQI